MILRLEENIMARKIIIKKNHGRKKRWRISS